MNKKQREINKNKYYDLIEWNSNKYKNASKCWKGVSYNHYRVMSDIVWKLVNEYEMIVFTEVIFKNNQGRADIFAYNGQMAVIIEVLESESDKKANLKDEYYPRGIPIMKVKTKDFDVNEFKI